MTSIYGMIYDELKAKIEHQPEQYGKYAPAFDILDREAINGIILDGETYWIEYSEHGETTDEALDLLEEYIESKGYKSLYK